MLAQMELPTLCLLLIAALLHTVKGDLDSTLKHCCTLGRREARCSSISSHTPVRGVASEHLSMCFTAMEICCAETDRAKQCSLGQEDARAGQDCVSLPGVAGEHRMGCCSACKLGMIMASMLMSCANHESLFGAPWNVAYMSCCSGSPYTGPREPLHAAHPVPQVVGRPVSKPKDDIGENDLDQDHFDLCEKFEGQLCDDICISTPGSYICTCRDGFTLDADNKTCTILAEKDRCRVNNPCSQRCKDTGMHVVCSCNSGYQLASDKKTCNDIDECAESNMCQLAGMTCKNELGTFSCVTSDGVVMQPGTLPGSAGADLDSDDEESGGKSPVSFKCPEGYSFNKTTSLCDDLDECSINRKICAQNFTCVNTVGSYYCDSLYPDVPCNPGFRYSLETKTCEDIDECQEDEEVCRRNNEKCLNTRGSYICHAASRQCPAGFKYDTPLRRCEDVDECAEKIHSCLPDVEQCHNTVGAYDCLGTELAACEQGLEFNETLATCRDVDECARGLDNCNPETEICLNIYGGFNCTLKSTRRPPTYSPGTSSSRPVFVPRPTAPAQSCQPGLKYDYAQKSCVDVDECSESAVPVCDSVQQCINSMGSYRCVCKQGFIEDPNTLACVDLNECQLDTHDCSAGQRCDNTIGSYKCFRLTSCGTGYTLNAHTGVCEDDNECLLKTNNCATLGPKFSCKNTAGSFRCVPKLCEGKKIVNSKGECVDQDCPTGYESSAIGRCIDINECLAQPCRENEKCVNTQGSFSCARKIDCGRGFEMNAEGTQCTDVDECTKGTHHCTPSQQCINTQGAYSCQCPAGYNLNQNKQCIDIDECSSYRSNYQLCASHSTCQNTPGSYRCNCKEGFRHQNDDKVCHDTDECSMGPGLCQHNCLNTWGSFRCSCNPGFTLQADLRSCHDVDECNEFKDRNLCIGLCQNTPGSYKCLCPGGYKLGNDERTCIDVDECSTVAGTCRVDQVCLNTRGSYQCNTIHCPADYTRENDHKNRCKKNSLYCREGDLECMRKPQTISNNYMTFVSNMSIPNIGYLDLFTMRGPMWQSTGVRFNLDLVNARAPAHIAKVTKDYFRVRRQNHNQAIISMTRSITGPQQIELHLTMDILHNGIFSGTVLAKLFIIVSEHEY